MKAKHWCSATKPPVTEAVHRVFHAIRLNDIAIDDDLARSPMSSSAVTARNDRPIRRWISVRSCRFVFRLPLPVAYVRRWRAAACRIPRVTQPRQSCAAQKRRHLDFFQARRHPAHGCRRISTRQEPSATCASRGSRLTFRISSERREDGRRVAVMSDLLEVRGGEEVT